VELCGGRLGLRWVDGLGFRGDGRDERLVNWWVDELLDCWVRLVVEGGGLGW